MAAGAPVVPGGGGGPRGRGRRPGGPGGPGGGGGGQPALPKLESFDLSGTRDKLTISVRVSERGGRPKEGAQIVFFLGGPGSNYKRQLLTPGGAFAESVTTNMFGIGIKEDLDLSSFAIADFTTITATVVGGSSNPPMTKDLPTDIKPPGEPSKTKRLKVLPEGDTTSFGKAIRRDFQTFATDGKTLESSRVRIVADVPVTIKDAANDQLLREGAQVARRVKFFEFETGPDGMQHVEFDFTGFVVKIQAIHVQTGAVIEFTLRHR